MVESYETETYTGEDVGRGSFLWSLWGSCFLGLKTCTFSKSPHGKVYETQAFRRVGQRGLEWGSTRAKGRILQQYR